MTLITLEQRIQMEKNTLDALYEEVAELREEVKIYRKRIKDAYDEDTDCKAPDVTCLTKLVRNCLDVEKNLAKCQYEQAGIGPCGYALDLDAARASIGRKLDRLRG
jgi:hypothetical protein